MFWVKAALMPKANIKRQLIGSKSKFMYSFLCSITPRSVNAKKKDAYYSGLVNAFKHYHGEISPISEYLYGFVYYFHRRRTELDADNLSKPIWDALVSTTYPDDNLILFRSSGLFDLQSEGIEVLDLSNFPDYLFEDFLEMIENEDHILYVELGKFDHGLFQFDYDG